MDVTPNPYQQPQSAPTAQQPSYAANLWTGGQKAGWFFVGLFGGIVGILLASLSNVGHPDRSTATKMAIIGCVAVFVIGFLFTMVAGCSMAALMASVPAYY